MNNSWYNSITKNEIWTSIDKYTDIKNAFEWMDKTDKDIIINALNGFNDDYMIKIQEVISKIWKDKFEDIFNLIDWLSVQKVRKILLSWEWIKKIQDVKQDIVSRIFKNIDSNNWYKIDGREVADMDSIYYDIINQIWTKDLKNKDRYINWLKADIETMYKTNESYILDSNNSTFTREYIWDFVAKLNLLQKYIWSSPKMLEKSLSDSLVSYDDKKGIREYIKLTSKNNIPNTRQKTIWIDLDLISDLTSKFNTMTSALDWKKKEVEDYSEQLKKSDLENRSVIEWKLKWAEMAISWMSKIAALHKTKVRNEKCFYETDLEWNKNYFSYNTLLNYIDTFWLEVWLPHIDVNDIPDDIRKYFFPSMDRVLKKHMSVTILEWLRDKQEVLMNNLTDYKLDKKDKSDVQAWFIAEKVVELEFRQLADLSEYNLKITKPSVWEDMVNKIDLFLELEDKKTGVKIHTELQITIRDDLELKKQQIAKRNKFLQKQENHTDSKLIDFTMKDLWKKLNFWKAHNRPIWKLSDTLDDVERTTIRDTFKRLVDNLDRKNRVIAENKK